MIEKLHAELIPLVDTLQEAADRGLTNLKQVPYRGLQWKHRAYQRDPFVVAFTQVIPLEFGTFVRRDELIAQRRLVFHSDALNLDLTLRRRGSLGAFRTAGSATVSGPVQDDLFPELRYAPVAAGETRQAALIWDVPDLNKEHKAIGPAPFAVRLAKPGRSLDENLWESGFRLASNVADELIPERIEYRQDMPDWNVDNETGAQ